MAISILERQLSLFGMTNINLPTGHHYPYLPKTNMYKLHTVESINQWHTLARPNPDQKAFNVQLGCHLEELAEMLETIDFTFEDYPEIVGKETHMYAVLVAAAYDLKHNKISARVTDRRKFIDSVGDQVVTSIGVAHCAGMNAPKAIKEVNKSNWSKFVEGKPMFNEHGKIAKPDTYQEPDLEGCY